MNYYLFVGFIGFIAVIVIDEYYCSKLQYEIEQFEAMQELNKGKKRYGLLLELKRWICNLRFKFD